MKMNALEPQPVNVVQVSLQPHTVVEPIQRAHLGFVYYLLSRAVRSNRGCLLWLVTEVTGAVLLFRL